MSGVEVFFDTNILLYRVWTQDRPKMDAARLLIRSARERGDGAISTQVMQECVNVLFRVETPTEQIHSLCETLLRPLLRVSTTAELIESAVDVKARWRYAFYDSLVIAAALACGAKTLYSEDLQHGQRIEHLTIVNPFL